MTAMRQPAGIVFFFAVTLLLSSCASTGPVTMKIHTDPEGSHVVYQVVDDEDHRPVQWIYLGITPYRGITVFDSDAFDKDDTITIKVMRHGYYDQVKKWTGKQFFEEYDRDGMLFWAPRLVKSGS